MGLFEAVLIGKSTIFGFILFGGPILYIYRNQINENLDEYEDQRELALEWEKIDEDAKKAREILDDYSFKIFLPCQVNGTGWILDYQIPEENHYPTVWYIATNAHVANHFRFASEDYGQELPRKLRNKDASLRFPSIPLDENKSCQLSSNENYFDFNLSKQISGKEFRSNYGGIIGNKMEEPKLFYAPIDFLKVGGEIKKDNYKDFAVIEVEFKTPSIAKDITNSFAEKYGTGSRKPLDFLTAPNDEERNPETIDYYSLGYQHNHKFEYTFSYEEEGRLTSQLAKNTLISDEEGRVNAQYVDFKNHDQMTDWAGRKLNRVGHFYMLENFDMAGGASGGLVIDADMNVLGIRSMGIYENDQSLVVPLKSKEIITNSFKTPEYDLILGGGPNQKTSYKQQVETHLFIKNKKTWLSEKGKWREAWENKKSTNKTD